MRSVLIVDGDSAITDPLGYLLEQSGFKVTVVYTGLEAIARLESTRPDLVLLEWQLPAMSGLEVCVAVRSASGVPIIVVTSIDAEMDKVAALAAGVDDYVTKPFSSRELIARIEAVLRRYTSVQTVPAATVLTAGPVRMDIDRHRVHIRGIETSLRLKGFTVLEFLIRNHSRLVTRDQLIERVWGDHVHNAPKRMEAIINRLRESIELDQNNPRHLVTIRGLGYRFDP